MGFDQGERGDRGVCVGFVLLASCTAFNVFLHKLCETWLPEFGGYELMSLEITGMTGSFMVVAAGKDGVMEGVH